jgi:hypothetical protein
MRLDHVSYAVAANELVDTVQSLGSKLGASFIDGGRHPRFGTRNFVLPLDGGTYIEVVAALDHPSAERVPFFQAVCQRAELGGGWLCWVISVDDIRQVEQRLGRTAVDGHRVRPDGYDLTWKQIGINDVIDYPALPYFTQWTIDPEQHPSKVANPTAKLVSCEIAGDPGRIREWLGGPVDSPIDNSQIQWVSSDEPGVVAIHFETPHGQVRID